jgi:dTDP-4-amino-4,6-dideoxygalactose transaminase
MITVTQSSLPPLEKYVRYLKRIWSSKWLTNNGEFVQLLEKKLAEYLKVKNLVVVSNGTVALQLALRAFELEGEVITTPFTFAATTNVILWEGLKPVFADIDPDTFNISPADVERKITDKTSAILAVHVYGNPCYVEKLKEIADRHNLKLLYDAAHAFGVEYKNQSILNYGDLSTLSFHATKVFTTIEGGAIVVQDTDLKEKLQLLRNHGIKSEEEVIMPGINAKMDEFQAAMGLCNLEDIDEKIGRRKKIYEHYKEKLSGYGKFQKIAASKYNYGYMPVCLESLEERDETYSQLIRNGIKPRKYFFPLTTDFNYFKKEKKNLVKDCKLKEARNASDRVLCLPLYPELEMEDVKKVVDTIRKVHMRVATRQQSNVLSCLGPDLSSGTRLHKRFDKRFQDQD